MNRVRCVVALAGAVWLAACAPVAPPPRPAESGPVRIVHVVSNGWHAGIVVARADLPHGLVSEAADLADFGFLEFGWGDREYYPAPAPTIAMALAAGLGANPAVIHLAGRAEPPLPSAELEVVRLALTGPGFTTMAEAIDATFDRSSGARAERVAPGLAPRSAFYAATGRFGLAKTCNTWVADMLAAGGVAIRPDGVATAEQLMARLRMLPEAAPRARRPSGPGFRRPARLRKPHARARCRR